MRFVSELIYQYSIMANVRRGRQREKEADWPSGEVSAKVRFDRSTYFIFVNVFHRSPTYVVVAGRAFRQMSRARRAHVDFPARVIGVVS